MPQIRRYSTNAQRQAAYRQRVAHGVPGFGEAPLPALPPVPAIATMPGWRRWRAMHARLRGAAEDLAEEVQAYHDARSTEWQESERGEALLERAEAYRELVASLDDLGEP